MDIIVHMPLHTLCSSQVDLFDSQDVCKGGEEVEGGEIEDEAKDDGDRESWQRSPDHAQKDGGQA